MPLRDIAREIRKPSINGVGVLNTSILALYFLLWKWTSYMILLTSLPLKTNFVEGSKIFSQVYCNRLLRVPVYADTIFILHLAFESQYMHPKDLNFKCER